MYKEVETITAGDHLNGQAALVEETETVVTVNCNKVIVTAAVTATAVIAEDKIAAVTD